ncbi:MAG TPA: hypothetical protein VGD61_15030 [Pyrinomonadaceae bacterium]
MKLKLCTLAVFAVIPILLASPKASNEKVSSHGPIKSVNSPPASAVLDDWGTRFASFGIAVGENERRTLIRTTIVQLAMFDAVNAALNGPYRGFASKPEAAPDASAEAAAIRAAYIVALHEFPTPTATAMIQATYSASLAGVVDTPDAITHGIEVGELAANNVIDARKNDNRNLPELAGYSPATGPGMWVPTPNGTINPQSPFLQFVTPFGYDQPSRFALPRRRHSIARHIRPTTMRSKMSVD